MIPRILDFMREQHPFTLLTEPERERIDATAVARTYGDGARIIAQDGQQSEFLYLLADGEVGLVRDGEELQVLEEGDCFGYPSMISRAAPAFDVIARGEVLVHCVPATVFRELLAQRRLRRVLPAQPGRAPAARDRPRRDRPRRRTDDGPWAILDLRAAVASRRAPPWPTPPTPCATPTTTWRWSTADPPGIVTDHDFQVKVLAEGLGPDTPVAQS